MYLSASWALHTDVVDWWFWGEVGEGLHHHESHLLENEGECADT